MTIDELGYVPEMRQRLGYEEDDPTPDRVIEDMTPMQRVRLIAGWFQGYGEWANIYRAYFESQGLYLTTNKDDPDIIQD